MANEAVLVIETGLPIPFTVANGTGIEKGALCALTDLMTAATSTAEADLVAGIAASEKIASDGKVKLGMYREGYFRVIASGSIAVGDPVAIDGDGTQNYTYSVVGTETLSGSRVLGIAMETAADEETYLIQLKPEAVIDPRA